MELVSQQFCSFEKVYVQTSQKHIRYTDTDILNKKLYIGYNCLLFKKIYLKNNVIEAETQ